MQRELQLREDVGRRSFPGQIFTPISDVLAVEIHIGDGHATTVVVAVAVEKRHAVEPQVTGVENPSRRQFQLLLRCTLARHMKDSDQTNFGSYGTIEP